MLPVKEHKSNGLLVSDIVWDSSAGAGQVRSFSAPAGPGTVAAGAAQRNPWESRFSFVPAPAGRRNWACAHLLTEGVLFVGLDAVSAGAQEFGLEVLELVLG